ncbi:MAG: helix-turn-helix domain-containing protein [Alphaproteobacteria bacterium]|nr:helix-turn-helix domain-containing protein [Alphaproteobacteria bacterium]
MTGDELRALRKAAGYSRPALASKCSLHADTIKYWEKKPVVDLRGYAVGKLLEALGPVGLPQDNGGESESRERRAFLSDRVFCAPDTRARGGVLGNKSRSIAWRGKLICGAKTRKGTPCQAKALPGKKRCKYHGGMSTGPKTADGRERIARAQRRRWAERQK